MKIYCNRCNGQTNHTVLEVVDKTLHDDENEISFWEKWEIIRCIGCEEICFRRVDSNSHDYDPERGIYYETVRYYPTRGDEILPIKPYYSVPPIVRNIYCETMAAFNNGLYLLSAAGLRAIIEGICKQENIIDGPVEKTLTNGEIKIVRISDLRGKINGLQEKGMIVKKHADILHQHRYLGNEALHQLETPSKATLSIAIDIIEHILDSLYEIDKKAQELIWMRQEKGKGKKKGKN